MNILECEFQEEVRASMRPEERLYLLYLKPKDQNSVSLALYQKGEVCSWLCQVVMRYELYTRRLAWCLAQIKELINVNYYHYVYYLKIGS